MTRAPVQVSDILDEREYTATRVRPMLTRLGYRSLLSVPLLREQQIMGGLTVWRKETGSFSIGSRQSASDICDAIGPGDPKRAAVPGDRG